jgi:hypothetical protein
MKTLSRILITVLVVLGVTFVVVLSFSSCQNGPGYAGCGPYEYKFGLDANGCESPVDHFPQESDLMAAGVSKECYKVRIWKKGHLVAETGNLAAIQCHRKTGTKFTGPEMTAPSGSGGTQRVMFNTSTARDAFDKKIKGAKK